MTLTEAKKKWGISYDTLCCWLDLGYLPNVTIDNGIIDIGNVENLMFQKQMLVLLLKVFRSTYYGLVVNLSL